MGCIYFETPCIWPINGTLIGITIQSGPENYGNKWVFQIPQISRAGALSLDTI